MNDIVPTNTASDDPVLTLLNRAALDPQFDASKFEIAVAFLRERETTSARRAFNSAMSAAQAEMGAVYRDRANDHLRSRYATLDGMLAVILPVISRHGLSLRFTAAPASQPGWMAVSCVISHVGGHVEPPVTLEGPIMTQGAAGGRTQMTAIQGVGSTATYLKRYALGMAFALVLSDEQDDDGEAGRGAGPRGEADRRTRDWVAPPTPRLQPGLDAPTPMPRPMTKPTQTIAAWLDAFELELAAVEGDEELDALLARDDAQRAQEMFTGAAKQRLDDMIQAALARSRARETTAPAGEPI